jgi:hypothetical protein
VDEGRKRVIGIMASILAARKLAARIMPAFHYSAKIRNPTRMPLLGRRYQSNLTLVPANQHNVFFKTQRLTNFARN